jgi:hypothetical protein
MFTNPISHMQYRVLLLLFSFIISLNAIAQSSKKQHLPKITSLSHNASIGFQRFSKQWGLFYGPRIIRNEKVYKIKGFDEQNGTDTFLKLSPNKKYVLISYIIKGYIGDGKTKEIHENALCVIIDIRNSEVVEELQSACGGEWNDKNQWIYDNRIIFSPNQ